VETDACNFQHPPEAEARFFIASVRRRPHQLHVSDLGGYALDGLADGLLFRHGCGSPLRPELAKPLSVWQSSQQDSGRPDQSVVGYSPLVTDIGGCLILPHRGLSIPGVSKFVSKIRPPWLDPVAVCPILLG